MNQLACVKIQPRVGMFTTNANLVVCSF